MQFFNTKRKKYVVRDKLFKCEPNRISGAPYLLSSKLIKISNSFIFVVNKEKMSEFVELFPNFKLSRLVLFLLKKHQKLLKIIFYFGLKRKFYDK